MERSLPPASSSGHPAPAQDQPRVILIAPRTVWLVGALSVGLSLLWVVAAQFIQVLLLLFLALILAEGIRPIVEWLHRYRLPHPVAILLIYVLAPGLLGVFLWILGDALVHEFSSFVEDVSRYLAQAQGALGQIQRWLDGRPQAAQVVNQLGGQLGGLLQQVVGSDFQGPLLVLTLPGKLSSPSR